MIENILKNKIIIKKFVLLFIRVLSLIFLFFVLFFFGIEYKILNLFEIKNSFGMEKMISFAGTVDNFDADLFLNKDYINKLKWIKILIVLCNFFLNLIGVIVSLNSFYYLSKIKLSDDDNINKIFKSFFYLIFIFSFFLFLWGLLISLLSLIFMLLFIFVYKE